MRIPRSCARIFRVPRRLSRQSIVSPAFFLPQKLHLSRRTPGIRSVLSPYSTARKPKRILPKADSLPAGQKKKETPAAGISFSEGNGTAPARRAGRRRTSDGTVRKCAEKLLAPDTEAAAEAGRAYARGTLSAEECCGKIFPGIRGLCSLTAQKIREKGPAVLLPENSETAADAEKFFAKGFTPESYRRTIGSIIADETAETADAFMAKVPDVWFSAGFVNPAKTARTLLESEYAEQTDVSGLVCTGREAIRLSEVPERMELLQRITEGKEKPEAAGLTPENIKSLAAAHAVSAAVTELEVRGAKTMTVVLCRKGGPEITVRSAAKLRYYTDGRVFRLEWNTSFGRAEQEAVRNIETAGYSTGKIPPEDIKSIVYGGKQVYGRQSAQD